MLTEPEAHKLLYTLCVKLGFCLPPADARRLKDHPPGDVQSFTDAVYRAEGLDPLTADGTVYRQVRDVVARAFREAAAVDSYDARH